MREGGRERQSLFRLTCLPLASCSIRSITRFSLSPQKIGKSLKKEKLLKYCKQIKKHQRPSRRQYVVYKLGFIIIILPSSVSRKKSSASSGRSITSQLSFDEKVKS